MSTLKLDCRKFSPNVFSKTKCQNCFRTKDGHSAEALENNRASRIVSKCGYLFVAPDWDFNLSVNRTKRWQRRWFVLYDDGELTYALDEFPDTIPQGTIDMNKVLEVTDAEAITGNEFAFAITVSDKAHFIKGTSREESKWWFDVLSRVVPRHLSRGKHRRHGTFPGGKSIMSTTDVISQELRSEEDLSFSSFERPKFLSSSEMHRNWLADADAEEYPEVFEDDDSVYIIEKCEREVVEAKNAINRLISDQPDEADIQVQIDELSKTDNYTETDESDSCPKNRLYQKRENKTQRNQRAQMTGVPRMIQDKNDTTDQTNGNATSNMSAIAAAEKLEFLESINSKQEISQSSTQVNMFPVSSEKPPSRSNHSAASNDRDNTLRFSPKKSSDFARILPPKTNLRKSESLKNIPSEVPPELKAGSSNIRRYHSFKGQCSVSHTHRILRSNSGCSSLRRSRFSYGSLGRQSYRSSAMGTFIRTGWLMRLTLGKEWCKHWFVLKDTTLTYYRDPSAEHCGIMDGILDLNQVKTIKEQESDKLYAFSLCMWDNKQYIIAAETEEFRSMWMQAIHYASNLWSLSSKEDFMWTEIVLPDHFSVERRMSSPSSLSSMTNYAEDEKTVETSSASSDDQSEYFSLVDEDEISDLSSSPRILPPSSPINRNVLSLVKEKSKVRGGSNIPKTSTPTSGPDWDNNFNEAYDVLNQIQKEFDSMYEEEYNVTDTNNSFNLNLDNLDLSKDLVNPCKKLSYDEERSKPSESYTSDSCYLSPQLSIEEKYQPEIQELADDNSSSDDCSECIILKSKLVATKEEIKKLKKELREAHKDLDNSEVMSYKLSQNMKLQEESYESQLAIMTAKIDDLTAKFSLAEKNYRQLKQKMSKNESKERRRSSLKNRENLSLTKEYETKLTEMEKKIVLIETTLQLSGTDESENAQNENQKHHSESSDTSSSTDLTSSDGNEFLSRLQVLGLRIQNVDGVVNEKCKIDHGITNPKILLQVRDSECSSSFEEFETWRTFSLNNSMQNLNKIMEEYPSNLFQCQSLLSVKLDEIVGWLQLSLEAIAKSNGLETWKQTAIQNMLEVINSVHHCNNEFSPSSIPASISLVRDIVRISEKLDRVDSSTNLMKASLVEHAFKVTIRTLCISFSQFENVEIADMVALLSTVPEVEFFCPVMNKLCQQNVMRPEVSTVSERLLNLWNQQFSVCEGFHEAKTVRYAALWNTLAEVPVQDANHKRTTNSILRHISSLVNEVYWVAGVQVSGLNNKSLYALKAEYDNVQTWCTLSSKDLEESLNLFMEELKETCPMIHESMVSFDELSEVTRKEITSLVLELAFICVVTSILNSMWAHAANNSEADCSGVSEKWLACLSKINSQQSNDTNFFDCPQCTLFNSYLPTVDTSWDNYLQKNRATFIKKHNFFPESSVHTNGPCSDCESWLTKVSTMEMERQTIELRGEQEIKHLEECLIKCSEVHEEELFQKEKDLQNTNEKFHQLKLEHEEQLKFLQAIYEEKLNLEIDHVDEERIRQTYEKDIEELKDMFRKGLVAIENSHSRITKEIEKRHQDELVFLEAEKEKALQLEAQATATALEAIKKTHELRLKEETEIIRETLTNKFQMDEPNVFYSKYGNELENLKDEILSITELYSSKCLENAALEEKANVLGHQLLEAHNQLHDLLTKNKNMSLSLVQS